MTGNPYKSLQNVGKLSKVGIFLTQGRNFLTQGRNFLVPRTESSCPKDRTRTEFPFSREENLDPRTEFSCPKDGIFLAQGQDKVGILISTSAEILSQGRNFLVTRTESSCPKVRTDPRQRSGQSWAKDKGRKEKGRSRGEGQTKVGVHPTSL